MRILTGRRLWSPCPPSRSFAICQPVVQSTIRRRFLDCTFTHRRPTVDSAPIRRRLNSATRRLIVDDASSIDRHLPPNRRLTVRCSPLIADFNGRCRRMSTNLRLPALDVVRLSETCCVCFPCCLHDVYDCGGQRLGFCVCGGLRALVKPARRNFSSWMAAVGTHLMGHRRLACAVGVPALSGHRCSSQSARFRCQKGFRRAWRLSAIRST